MGMGGLGAMGGIGQMMQQQMGAIQGMMNGMGGMNDMMMANMARNKGNIAQLAQAAAQNPSAFGQPPMSAQVQAQHYEQGYVAQPNQAKPQSMPQPQVAAVPPSYEQAMGNNGYNDGNMYQQSAFANSDQKQQQQP